MTEQEILEYIDSWLMLTKSYTEILKTALLAGDIQTAYLEVNEIREYCEQIEMYVRAYRDKLNDQ